MNTEVERKNYLFIVLTLVTVIACYTYFSHQQKKYSAITSFKECLAAGYPVILTYPEECRIPGKRFTNPEQKIVKQSSASSTDFAINDFKNGAYILNGQLIRLQNGVLEFITSQNTARRLQINASSTYEADINGDTIKDTVFIIEEMPLDGSIPKQYLTASVSLRNGFVGLNMLSLGEVPTVPALDYRNADLVLSYMVGTTSDNLIRRFRMDNDILVERISP